jgi:HPr kinase/phosphorylase
MAPSTTVHASAVLVGARAVLALDLIDAARTGSLLFARLVADDRVHLDNADGRLLVRPAEALAGLIEVRGVGLLRMAYEASAVVGLVVDLATTAAARLPDQESLMTEIGGIELPRLAVASGIGALSGVLALINSPQASWI